MSRLVATLGGRRFGGDAEWFARLRESVHLWNAVPIGLAAVTLTVGGFWLGSAVSGGDAAAAAAATRTIHLQGRVITKNGIQYVATPARTVLVKGKPVRLAAQTVPLAGHTTILPGSTIHVATTVNDTATVVKTATVQVTVTAPASTVTGPTTTVTDTTTVPIISTVTITTP
ncbi:MAG TPA: hypothetical protein VLB81_05640 [Gaiellales bacterium]|nr:hypothetical protein [Gaiellales bacterium]